jgi:hypothetical protein
MSNQVSGQGMDGVCSFCRRQLNGDASLGSGPRGGVYQPHDGAPPIFMCTACVATDAIAELFAGAVLDSSLDPGTCAAGLIASVSAKLGLPT